MQPPWLGTLPLQPFFSLLGQGEMGHQGHLMTLEAFSNLSNSKILYSKSW